MSLTQAVAKHLNILESTIVEVQEWANVLWVRFTKRRPRFVSKKIKQQIKTKIRVFKKSVTYKSIVNNISFYGYRSSEEISKISDQELIKEWHYSKLAHVAIRYRERMFHNGRYGYCPLQTMGQVNETYLKKLQIVLESRMIFEDADSTYYIDFERIKQHRKTI